MAPRTTTETETTKFTEQEQARLVRLLADTRQEQTLDDLARTVIHAGLKAIERRRRVSHDAAPTDGAILRAQQILARAGIRPTEQAA